MEEDRRSDLRSRRSGGGNREFAVVASFGLHLGEAASDHLGEEFLGFDERHLYVAVGVAVECELACHALGKSEMNVRRWPSRGGREEFALFGSGLLGEVGCLGEQVVELGNEALHGGDELDESLGNEDCAEVVALFCASGDDAGYIVDNILKGLVLASTSSEMMQTLGCV